MFSNWARLFTGISKRNPTAGNVANLNTLSNIKRFFDVWPTSYVPHLDNSFAFEKGYP